MKFFWLSKKIIVLATIHLSLAAHAETYVEYIERINSIKHEWRPGEKLSEVLQSKGYQNISGQFGALNQTYWKNGLTKGEEDRLKSPKIIFLPYVERVSLEKKIDPVPVASASASAPAESKKVERKISFIPGMDEWNISALYGARYMSNSQDGDLGNVDFGVLFLNNVKLKSEFVFENWTGLVSFDSYKFKYESEGVSDEKRMYALSLGASYKWFMGGLGMEQGPIFRNVGGATEMARQGQVLLYLGAKKNIELPTRKPTVAKLKGWLSRPLSSSSDESAIELSSISGFGIHGQVELNRQIISKDQYSVHAVWQTDLSYLSVSQDVKWDTSNGKIDSKIIGLATALGVLLKF